MVLHRLGGEMVLHKLLCGVKDKSSGRTRDDKMTSRGPFQSCETALVVSWSCEKGEAHQGSIFPPGVEISMLRTCFAPGHIHPLSTAGQVAPRSSKIQKKLPMELGVFRAQQQLGKIPQYPHLYSDFWVLLNPAHILFSRSDLDTQETEQPLTGALSPSSAQTCKCGGLLHVPHIPQFQEEMKSLHQSWALARCWGHWWNWGSAETFCSGFLLQFRAQRRDLLPFLPAVTLRY